MFMTDEKPKRKRKRSIKLNEDDCAIVLTPDEMIATFADRSDDEDDLKQLSDGEYMLLGLIELFKDQDFVDYLGDYGQKSTKTVLDKFFYNDKIINPNELNTLKDIDKEIGAILNNERWS